MPQPHTHILFIRAEFAGLKNIAKTMPLLHANMKLGQPVSSSMISMA
jgi:hypothetical protein